MNMNHESIRIHEINVKGCRVLGVTMATKPHSTVYESAKIGINYYNILCSSKMDADLSFVNF